MIEIYLKLAWEFFKTGLFSVGGGLATLPFLYRLATKTGWYTAEDVGNMIAISESTPGAIGVNMSTYVGNMVAGIPGGVVATFSLVLPSIIVIILISKILEKFKNSQVVKDAFYGLRPASLGLIAAAGLGVAKITLFTDKVWDISQIAGWFEWTAILLMAAVFVGMRKTKVHPVVFIAISAVVGIVFKM